MSVLMLQFSNNTVNVHAQDLKTIHLAPYNNDILSPTVTLISVEVFCLSRPGAHFNDYYKSHSMGNSYCCNLFTGYLIATNHCRCTFVLLCAK